MKTDMASLIFKDLLIQGLREDGSQLDWTTRGATSGAKNLKSKAKIVAKSKGTWTGQDLLLATELVSLELGHPLEIKSLVKEGARLLPGDTVCEWKGSPQGILLLERPFLNIASFTGGIASKTRTLVDLIESKWKSLRLSTPPPRLTLTRKTLPHYRDISILAVMAGGGFSHRVSLSGGILIKENHIRAAGSIKKALESVRRIAPHSLRPEIEVTSLDELKQALVNHAEIIMLDNFLPDQIKSAMKIIDSSSKDHRPIIEVSGGIDEKNIPDYVIPGVDIISVGSLTHSVKAIDLSLLMV